MAIYVRFNKFNKFRVYRDLETFKPGKRGKYVFACVISEIVRITYSSEKSKSLFFKHCFTPRGATERLHAQVNQNIKGLKTTPEESRK